MQARRIYQFREIITTSNLLAIPGIDFGNLKKPKTSLKSAKKLTFFVLYSPFNREGSTPRATSAQKPQVTTDSSSKQSIHLTVNGQPVHVPVNGMKHETISDNNTTTTVDIHVIDQPDQPTPLNNSVELRINTNNNQTGGGTYIET